MLYSHLTSKLPAAAAVWMYKYYQLCYNNASLKNCTKNYLSKNGSKLILDFLCSCHSILAAFGSVVLKINIKYSVFYVSKRNIQRLLKLRGLPTPLPCLRLFCSVSGNKVNIKTDA